MGKRNLQKCILALPSMTYAMRAAELLGKYNIRAEVRSLDAGITKKGCSHGITFDCRNKPSVKNILLENSIPVSDIPGA